MQSGHSTLIGSVMSLPSAPGGQTPEKLGDHQAATHSGWWFNQVFNRLTKQSPQPLHLASSVTQGLPELVQRSLYLVRTVVQRIAAFVKGRSRWHISHV